ncbi:putative glucosylceramidase 4 [Armadillidium vulgare]|nr:putative glucosylceramidase 4 [Armadillidium vulgare]
MRIFNRYFTLRRNQNESIRGPISCPRLQSKFLSSDCTKRYYGFSSFVCVCDANYCNYDADPTAIAADQVRVIKTSQNDYRNNEEIFQRQDGTFDPSEVDFSISVDPNNRRQSMIGFGGAMTDAAGINIKSLSQAAQDNLIRKYFGSDGSRYSIIRVPIAGSDFSTHPYTYDDIEGDVDLVYFDLTDEDYSYKLPLIKQAVEQSSDDIYVFGSPWSPPAWMKTNGMINGSGELLPEMWQPFSNYLLKFFQKYEENLGIELWGFTPENEPLVGFQPDFPWNNCGWTAENMRDWIKTNLGPTLSNAGYRRLKLMIDDHNRDTLPSFVEPSERC